MADKQTDLSSQKSVISLRLKTAREGKGLTQKDMGQLLGMSAQGYARYEKGSDIRSTLLLQLCAILECSPSWLLGIKDVGSSLPPESELLSQLIELYYCLNKKGQKYLIDFTELLASHPRFNRIHALTYSSKKQVSDS
jgi:transcriptional regulator with XRE-family HTH domain